MKNIVCTTIIFCILCGVASATYNISINNDSINATFNNSVNISTEEIINQTSIHLYNKTSGQLLNDTVNDSEAYVINQTAIALTNKTSGELANETTMEKIDTASLVLTNKTAAQLASDAANDTKNQTMIKLNNTKNRTAAELNNQSANLQNYSQEKVKNITIQVTDNGNKGFLAGLIDILMTWGKQFCMHLRQ